MSRGLETRHRGLLLVIGLTAVAIFLSSLVSRAPGASNSCSPSAGSRTLASTSSVRIYMPKSSNSGSKVYACIRPSGRAWVLGPHPVKGWMASMPGPFPIQGKWAAGFERRQVGRDTTELLSTARNAGSGKSRARCLVGGADRPEQLPKIQKAFVTPSGTVVWVALIRLGKAGTQIGTCEGSSSRVIVDGDGIDTKSVSLTAFLLRWKDASGEHSETLH